MLPLLVMAGLIPAIHASVLPQGCKDVDARDKRGHDSETGSSIQIKPT